jgi:hypothetical protein
MTRKDYKLIASVIKACASDWKEKSQSAIVCDNLANAMADELAKDNPAFDRSRFMSACMPE